MSKSNLKSPETKRLENFAQNPHEAVDSYPVGFMHWKTYSKIDARQFGMTSKKIRRQRK